MAAPPLTTCLLDAAPVLWENSVPVELAVADALDSSLDLWLAAESVVLAAAATGVVVLYIEATMLDQLDSALRTLAQPEHSVAFCAWSGWEVATAGMPVMTPIELVMVV